MARSENFWHLMNIEKVMQDYFFLWIIRWGKYKLREIIIWYDPFRVPAGSDEQTNKTAALSLAS